MLAVVAQDGAALQYSKLDSDSCDRELLLTAVKSNWRALNHMPPNCRRKLDSEILLAAVQNKKSGDSWEALSELEYVFQNGPHDRNHRVGPWSTQSVWEDILLAAFQKNWRALKHVPIGFPCLTAQIMLVAVKQNWQALEYACKHTSMDAEVVLTAVKQDWKALKYVCHRSDVMTTDILMEAAQQNWEALEFVCQHTSIDAQDAEVASDYLRRISTIEIKDIETE